MLSKGAEGSAEVGEWGEEDLVAAKDRSTMRTWVVGQPPTRR